MRVIAASVLTFEGLIVLLAIPVAITLGGVEPGIAIAGGVALAVVCLVVAASLSRPWGYQAGWVVQGLVLASGFVVTAMFLVGGLFVVLWVVGLRVGRRGEQLRAERWSGVEDPSSPPADAAG
jgi:hypothetical protein